MDSTGDTAFVAVSCKPRGARKNHHLRRSRYNSGKRGLTRRVWPRTLYGMPLGAICSALMTLSEEAKIEFHCSPPLWSRRADSQVPALTE